MADATNTQTETTVVAPVAEKPQTTKKTGRVLNDTRPEPRRTLDEGKKLTKDEKSLVIDAAKKTVSTTYTVKMNKDAKFAYVMDTIFDYSNCSPEEILALANSSVVISAQSMLRALGDAKVREPNTFKRVDVKSVIIDTEKTSVDPETRAVRAMANANLETVVDNMTPEQLDAMMKAIAARKRAKNAA